MNNITQPNLVEPLSVGAVSDDLHYAPSRTARLCWIGGFLLVFIAAVTARAWIQFAGELPPAMDPAYYPMQAWWLLNEGRLLYQDAPLIFVLDGLLAKVFIVTGMQSDSAYLVASQVVDCVTEPWVALFVFLFGFAWCGGALVYCGGRCIRFERAHTWRIICMRGGWRGRNHGDLVYDWRR